MSSNASYKGARLGSCRLNNSYAALQESFRYGFPGTDPDSLLTVPASSNNSMDQLHEFEPSHTPKPYIDSSPLCTAMFQRYGEFRIRKVMIKLTELHHNPINVARSDVWLYWVPNHTRFDAEKTAGNTFADVADLSEASRVQYMQTAPGKTVTLEVVPQVIFQQGVTIGGVTSDISGDGKMPWMACTDANKDNTALRFPIFYFRKPYLTNTSVPTQPQYQVICTAVIEFRNLEDDN